MKTIFATLLLLAGLANADDKKEWIESSAELVTYEEKWFYDMEVGVAGEDDSTTSHLQIICPMAEFRFSESVYGKDHRIEVLFSSVDDQRADILKTFRMKDAVGKTYSLLLPKDFFESRYGSVEFSHIGGIHETQGHNK